jgi:hypothetical protein
MDLLGFYHPLIIPSMTMNRVSEVLEVEAFEVPEAEALAAEGGILLPNQNLSKLIQRRMSLNDYRRNIRTHTF